MNKVLYTIYCYNIGSKKLFYNKILPYKLANSYFKYINELLDVLDEKNNWILLMYDSLLFNFVISYPLPNNTGILNNYNNNENRLSYFTDNIFNRRNSMDIEPNHMVDINIVLKITKEGVLYYTYNYFCNNDFSQCIWDKVQSISFFDNFPFPKSNIPESDFIQI